MIHLKDKQSEEYSKSNVFFEILMICGVLPVNGGAGDQGKGI